MENRIQTTGFRTTFHVTTCIGDKAHSASRNAQSRDADWQPSRPSCRRLLALWVICWNLCYQAWGEPAAWQQFPEPIQQILRNTSPLDHPMEGRMPLFLWPAHDGVANDPVVQKDIISALNKRGVAMIATWKGGQRPEPLAAALQIARIQKALGLVVCVNANDCMYGFFDGSPETSHVDSQGESFFDTSIPGGKIGCPFRIEHQYAKQKAKIDYHVAAYQAANVPLNFVFGDWEIDGPLEINRAWEASQRCVVCRQHIGNLGDFAAFQDAVRAKRCEATRRCYAEPVLSRFPQAWVGNYGVYPHDGNRYWYDYFEVFYDRHPHIREQAARYRRWVHDFPLTAYTMAMPVVYPWSRGFPWYEFTNSDYRWFYNMLLVGSNACKSTEQNVPIVPFVHWHTVFESGEEDDTVPQMSRWAYQELLWHLLLRGADTFFMWCTPDESPDEIALVHEVWRESLAYSRWLQQGRPITFAVPSSLGTVVSGIRLGNQLLVRRTDFPDTKERTIELPIDGSTITVPSEPGCHILSLKP